MIERVRVVIEVPKYGMVKRERREDGSFVVDYVSPLPSPFNYGCVPGRAAPDGDPADAVVLGPRLAQGTAVYVPIRGVVRFVDDGVQDDKLVCSEVLPSATDRLRVERFFRVYAVARGLINRTRGRTGATAFVGVEMEVAAGGGQVRIWSGPTLAEAHLVRESLAAGGLTPRLRGEMRPSYVGEIPIPDACVEVLVPEAEAREARALLAALDVAAVGPDWTCDACGEPNPVNFADCWECHAPRSNPAPEAS